MSYLVLARKWRPQRFAEVVAQPHVVQALQNAIRLSRLPHALLLTGSRGVGKTTIARLIAKAVNCFHVQGSEGLVEPCNQCEMCQEITAGRSVDIVEIDGASNRSIDDIRELRDNVQYLPTKGRRKVYIIDEVHMLTREAFNALLKTLEEPPSHVLFLFATTEAHKIPITILSRCQRFDFKRISLQHLREHLGRVAKSEKIELSEAALTMVARAAAGGMRDALSLLDQVIAFGGEAPSDEAVAQAIGVINRTILLRIGKAIFQRDPVGCLRCLDELFTYAYDLRSFTQELAGFLRDLTVIKIADDPRDLVDLSDDEIAAFRDLIHDVEIERIQQSFRLLTQGAEEIAQSNHPRLLLEMILIRMARIESVRSFDSLFKRLTQLETSLFQLQKGLPSAGGSIPAPTETLALSPPTLVLPSRPPDLAPAPPPPSTLRPQAKDTSPARPPVKQAHASTADKQVSPERPTSPASSRTNSSAPATSLPPPSGSAKTASSNPTRDPKPSRTPAPTLAPSLTPSAASLAHPASLSTPTPTSGSSSYPSTPTETAPTVAKAKPLPPLTLRPDASVTVQDWEAILAHFQAQHADPFYVGKLQSLNLGASPPSVITLRLPLGAHFSLHDIQEKLPQLEAFLRSRGIERRVQILEEAHDPGGSGEFDSVLSFQERKKSLWEKEIIEEAQKHPSLQKVQDLFPKAKLQRVHVLRDQSEITEDG